MNLVIFFDEDREATSRPVRFALAHPVLAAMVFGRHDQDAPSRSVAGGRLRIGGKTRRETTVWAVPEGWTVGATASSLVRFGTDVPLDPLRSCRAGDGDWLVIENGRFSAPVNGAVLRQALEATTASVVAVQARCDLMGYHERTIASGDGTVVGFRRFYEDSAEPVPMPKTWPHRLLVRAAELERVFDEGIVPRDFSRLIDRWRCQGVACAAIEVAGLACDLSTEAGLWQFFVSQGHQCIGVPAGWTLANGQGGNRHGLGTARCSGKVWLGPGSRIGSDVVIVGPSVIGDRVQVEDKAVVASSIIGPGVTIGRGRTVRDSLLTEAGQVQVAAHPCGEDPTVGSASSGFRSWPWFAYARGPKRVLDIVAAGMVMVIFAPVLPLIVLAIKLDSKGPIFFKDRREGRHGRPFRCAKFRSMKVGADQIQEKLRAASDVDGPQFKMADDPRITRVGHFLRETYLDEIPQFLNVLAGQMSVIGPRPSPKAENTLCPYWRYARLSVRPGVTGLWQVKRTRQPMKDFQEWIIYDTEYVKNLSFWQDVKICWETFLKMLGKFAEQF